MTKYLRFIKTGLLLVLLSGSLSCSKYLDIVPDNTITLEDYFSRREMAWNALSKVYSYLPSDPHPHNTTWTLGDEFVGRLDYNNEGGNLRAMRIMRGLQNTQDPLLGLWSGTNGGKSLYAGIRNANIFLEYIDLAEDMTSEEIADWKAQVTFLKAYYHFLLIRQYGPIVIADNPVALDALAEDLFQRRSKVEDCFDFVIRLMNEAIPKLKERAATTDLGQVDRVIATAIKARVMLYRASPFFNGNGEFYKDFLDFDGQPFFPLEYKAEKWNDALDAINEAITLCETNGVGLYEYDKNVYIYDRSDYADNGDNMKTFYDLRMLIVDPWNKELIWGQTYKYDDENTLASSCNIRLPRMQIDGVDTQGRVEEAPYSWQWMAASYKMLERYYTKNGLPPSEDITFDIDNKFDLVTIPGVSDPAYETLKGIIQPGVEIVKLYLDREPRFYANLGLTGTYWRSHSYRIPISMFIGEAGGLGTPSTDFLSTGIGVKKFVHPDAKSGGSQFVIRFPYPIIRMADLYLMKAEVLNEIDVAPKSEVYAEINKVRRRAGIPNVETVWANASLVRPESRGKHLNKDGLRDIILQERSIELAFEGGHRFWDMHRYKKATSEFSSPIMGWNYYGATAERFFVVMPKQARRFLIKDYLWPLGITEMDKNSNLIQNPGW
ncbi:MAG: RagB/SusD family nutrient uptake outer membrane protein [Prevotellaceae bacterium]|jgi:hypothetical protein|nr:RagB/SusD family nutrient uptake outer membrane protein [Prevotellaceae bacterium]